MGMLEQDVAEPVAVLAELKAYLRVEGSGEDALLGDLIRAAQAVCEQFVGQWLIVREAREIVAASPGWTRLLARPVVAIDGVEGVDAEGAAVALAVGAYAVDIDAQGEGWVRVVGALPVSRLRVTYRAGLAVEADGLPESIRQGVIRLAAEHYAMRTGGEARVPAVVTALWRPWRRMRIA